MKILDIKNITREDGEIFYRRTFTGTAVIQFPLKTTEEPVTFTIEMTPLGTKNIEIEFKEKIDVPLLPVLKAMKEIIKQKDFEGNLPL